jgi:ABC-2 type transport system permease protein
MTTLRLAVIDQSGYFDEGKIERANLEDKDSTVILNLTTADTATLKNTFKKDGYDGFVIIPAISNWESGIKDVSLRMDKARPGASGQVRGRLNNIWDDVKNEKLGIDEAKKIKMKASTISVKSEDTLGKSSNAKTATGVGLAAGFMIYIILIVYGTQVMMGVMEEKTNRIAEVIISSVKPFQLMLGKIVGIGLVGLTQFLLWIGFVLVIYNGFKAAGTNSEMMTNMVGDLQKTFTSIDIPLILFCFGFYFLAGFFFYASLYAAVGSAANEDVREAQSLSFPITMLIIFSIATLGVVLQNPSGPIAFWGSLIPFSSPIIMMIRVPFGVPETVPYWQLALSMGILIASFMFNVWLSGKIYRTGILMYGKKPSWKELIKWAFRKS